MDFIIRSSLSEKKRYIASIDLGSHTARFLLCRVVDAPYIFQPVIRKRFYTNLAKGFNQEGAGVISQESMKRAINAIEEFSIIAEKYKPEFILGAATGIFRRAKNSNSLLEQIKEKTGINIKVISGEEEAELTLVGVVHALKLTGSPDIFFDLGGSTTEIIHRNDNQGKIVSLPIGAFVLKHHYLRHDPPKTDEIKELIKYINELLSRTFDVSNFKNNNALMIGSGGTVTSLAALIYDLNRKDVKPEKINGMLLESFRIEEFYNKVKSFPFSERERLKSIDKGRAEVILAGSIAVLELMSFFRTTHLTVSYSDILEGLLLSYLKGEKNE